MFISQTVYDSTGKRQREDSYFAQYQWKDSVRMLVTSFRYLSVKNIQAFAEIFALLTYCTDAQFCM